MNKYIDDLNRLTAQYNDAIRTLKDNYDLECRMSSRILGSVQLRHQYSKHYEALIREYATKKQQLLTAYKQDHPVWAKHRRMWEWGFVVAAICMMVCCTASIASLDDDEPIASTALNQQTTTYWNAENIDIPYLKDATQYVANPDSVLSAHTVNRMNTTLGRLEKEVGVQSVFIIVNHIENGDPFRMAQDVGNKYGVGYDNRGLVVVVGYLDHNINISPGRKLEADLTDAECYRLEQDYVIPAMRAEQPDSGMIYLADAVLATLQKKSLPQMSQLRSSNTDDASDDVILTFIGFIILTAVGGSIAFSYLNRKYMWVPMTGAVALMSNPFYESSGVYVGGGGFGNGGGGGGFSGGSFGGGSFGGGGATSSW